MINEYDLVVLRHNLPEHNLKIGDVGTAVMVHGGGTGYEVEFTTLTGETLGVVTVHAEYIRPVSRREIAPVREVA